MANKHLDRASRPRMGRPVRWAASALGLGLATFTSGAAFGFCQTTTCDSRVEPCPVNPSTLCPLSGLPLYWPDTCVTFGVQKDASPKRGVTFAQARDATQDAFRSWISAKCNATGEQPSIGVVALGEIECDQVQYNYPAPGQDFPPGPNANVVVFRDDTWPYADDEGSERVTLALTTITYLKETGEIVDADIEVNSASVALSTGDTAITNDLQSILAHEVGHFFGLAHSEVPGATMNKRYNVNVGDATFRTLSDDDRRGICSIYPPNAVQVGDCRGEGPRYGFSRYCHTPVQASAGLLCSAPRAPGSQPWSWVGGLFAVAAVGCLATRRRCA